MTGRHTVNTITSDALDALYEQLEAAEAGEAQRQLATAREALASATTRAARAEAALASARALHRPQPDGSGFPDSQQCGTCSQDGGDGYQYLVPYPCPTICALDQPTTSPTAWTPPPPGDTREQLPPAVLALLPDQPYTSTACDTADACQTAAETHPVERPWLAAHADELHARCRLNHKFTGQMCVCACHGEHPTPAATEATDNPAPASLTGTAASEEHPPLD